MAFVGITEDDPCKARAGTSCPSAADPPSATVFGATAAAAATTADATPTTPTTASAVAAAARFARRGIPLPEVAALAAAASAVAATATATAASRVLSVAAKAAAGRSLGPMGVAATELRLGLLIVAASGPVGATLGPVALRTASDAEAAAVAARGVVVAGGLATVGAAAVVATSVWWEGGSGGGGATAATTTAAATSVSPSLIAQGVATALAASTAVVIAATAVPAKVAIRRGGSAALARTRGAAVAAGNVLVLVALGAGAGIRGWGAPVVIAGKLVIAVLKCAGALTLVGPSECVALVAAGSRAAAGRGGGRRSDASTSAAASAATSVATFAAAIRPWWPQISPSSAALIGSAAPGAVVSFLLSRGAEVALLGVPRSAAGAYAAAEGLVGAVKWLILEPLAVQVLEVLTAIGRAEADGQRRRRGCSTNGKVAAGMGGGAEPTAAALSVPEADRAMRVVGVTAACGRGSVGAVADSGGATALRRPEATSVGATCSSPSPYSPAPAAVAAATLAITLALKTALLIGGTLAALAPAYVSPLVRSVYGPGWASGGDPGTQLAPALLNATAWAAAGIIRSAATATASAAGLATQSSFLAAAAGPYLAVVAGAGHTGGTVAVAVAAGVMEVARAATAARVVGALLSGRAGNGGRGGEKSGGGGWGWLPALLKVAVPPWQVVSSVAAAAAVGHVSGTLTGVTVMMANSPREGAGDGLTALVAPATHAVVAAAAVAGIAASVRRYDAVYWHDVAALVRLGAVVDCRGHLRAVG
ncbi:hypothetical protein MMPV_001959 [Pyropia vietnamensis]